MLQDTLTAFCPKGDGTWQTTQLFAASQCTGPVQNAGGDLVCEGSPQVGPSIPPQGYGSSYGSASGTLTPPGGYPPPYPPGLAATSVPPPYNGYSPAGNSVPDAYGTNEYGPYGGVTSSSEQYYSPSANKTARPYGY
jgi:hypothetical protein